MGIRKILVIQACGPFSERPEGNVTLGRNDWQERKLTLQYAYLGANYGLFSPCFFSLGYY